MARALYRHLGLLMRETAGKLGCCPDCCPDLDEFTALFSGVTGCQCAEVEEIVATIAFDVLLLIDPGGPPGGGTLWDGTVSYAQGDYVYDSIDGTYYVAVQAVPGTPLPAPPIPLSDTNYWVPYTANDIDYVGYIKDSGSSTCWPGNTSAGGFTSGTYAHPSCASGPWSQSITGSFTSSKLFTAWYNQFSSCAAEDDIGFTVTITNTGADSLRVNGTSVAPGGSIGIGAAWAGYDNGDQSGYGSGTSILVEKDYVGTGNWFTIDTTNFNSLFTLPLVSAAPVPTYELPSACTVEVSVYSDDTCETLVASSDLDVDISSECVGTTGFSMLAQIASGTVGGVDFTGVSLFDAGGWVCIFNAASSNILTCDDPLDTGAASGGNVTISLP